MNLKLNLKEMTFQGNFKDHDYAFYLLDKSEIVQRNKLI